MPETPQYLLYYPCYRLLATPTATPLLSLGIALDSGPRIPEPPSGHSDLTQSIHQDTPLVLPDTALPPVSDVRPYYTSS